MARIILVVMIGIISVAADIDALNKVFSSEVDEPGSNGGGKGKSSVVSMVAVMGGRMSNTTVGLDAGAVGERVANPVTVGWGRRGVGAWGD